MYAATKSKNVFNIGGAVNQRFEIKYLIGESTAQRIIDFLSVHMDPDPSGPTYPVTSLYLDNKALSMFWSSELGERNRYKLRLRSYSDDDNSQIFAEVKRRLDKVVLKSRVPIHRDRVSALLNGFGDIESMLKDPNDARGRQDLYYFRELQDVFQAKPCTGVRYQREAYVSRNGEPLRITFDRDLAGMAMPRYSEEIWNKDCFWHSLPQVPVVLEVKFTDQYPQWVQKMIQRFDLVRGSMAKYVQCVKTLQSDAVPFTSEKMRAAL